MIIRHSFGLFSYSSWLVLFLGATSAVADEAFDCHVEINSSKFDLTSLAGERELIQQRDSPPTQYEDRIRFNICGELQRLTDYSEEDQCSSDTRVCITTVNKKSDKEDRVVSVIPVVQTASLNPIFSLLSSPSGVSAVFHGPEYPHPIDAKPSSQSLSLTILCAQELQEPQFISYNSSVLRIDWSAPAGCASTPSEPDKGGNDDGDESNSPDQGSSGSGIGWFFLVLLLAIVGYFGLGAYYNYSNYGASGMDLIPHRDFWQEVPYMLKDVAAHLCSSIRPRRASSRGGYISV